MSDSIPSKVVRVGALAVAGGLLGALVAAFPLAVTGHAPQEAQIAYSTPGAGRDMGPYNADPGPVIDIDFLVNGGELDRAQYRVAGGPWQTIFDENCAAHPPSEYTDDWAVDWAFLGDDDAYAVDIQVKECDSDVWIIHEYEEDVKGFRFLKDTAPPESQATSPPTSPVNWVINIDWVVDDQSDIATVVLWRRYEDGGWQLSGLQGSGASGVFSFLPSDGLGTYYFELVATDEAGNEELRAGSYGDTQTEVVSYTVCLPLALRNYVLAPDLGTSRKRADQEAVDPGATLGYTIVLTNSGNLTASVTLTDPIPAQTTFRTGTATGCYYSAAYDAIWWTDTLDPGMAHECSFAVGVLADAVGTVANAAEIYDDYGPDPLILPQDTPVRGWHRGLDLPPSLAVYSLAACPEVSTTVYAGTQNRGVFLSVDGGRHWNPTGMTNDMVWGLAVEPGSNCEVVYATTWGNGMKRTDDGGDAWYTTNAGLQDFYLYAVAIDGERTVYAGTYNHGVFKRAYGESDWAFAGLSGKEVDWLAIDPTDPDILYAATWGEGIFRTEDGATTPWTEINEGLDDLDVYAVAIDPQNTDVLYAATYGGGIFFSDDGGENWADEGWGSRVAYAVTVTGDSWAYAGTDGAVTPTSGQALWERPVGDAWRAMVPQPGNGLLKVRSLTFSALYPVVGTTDGVWWYGVAP